MEKKELTYIEDVPEKVNNIFFLLHGFASDAEDIMEVGINNFRKILPSTVLISVNAPDIADNNMGGYQWFSFKTINVINIIKEIKHNYFLLNEFIDNQLKRFNLPSENMFIGGFSQGAMMSLFLGPRRKIAPMGVLSFSGLLPDTINTLKNDMKSHPETLLIHGTEDKTIPFEKMREAEKILRELDIPVETHQIQGMEHLINDVALEYARDFIIRICNKV